MLELIVVILIIGILGTFGFAQYARMTEKSRGVEAKTVLSSLRALAQSFYLEYGSYKILMTGSPGYEDVRAYLGIGDADSQVPWAESLTSRCRSSYYFTYRANSYGQEGMIHTYYLCARRCGQGQGGKEPSGDPAAGIGLMINTTTWKSEWVNASSECFFSYNPY